MNRNRRAEVVRLLERPKPKCRRIVLLHEDGIRRVEIGRLKEGELIVEFTQSFKFWLNTTYPSLSVPLSFLNFEDFNRDHVAAYFDWRESKMGIEFLNENREYKGED